MNYQDIFKEVYLDKIGIPFLQWGGKEGSSLKSLYQLIKVFWFEFKEITLDEEQQLDGFKHFLRGIEDDFVLGSFTPSTIYACFNSLAQQQYSKVKPKSNTIRFKIPDITEEQLKEIELIKEGYKRLRNER